MGTRRMYALVLLFAALGLVLGACGDDDDTTDTTADVDDTSPDTEAEDTDAEDDEPDADEPDDTEASDDGASVGIVDFAFSPEDLTVSAGAEVTVTNRDGVAHTYTSSDELFDSGSISGGAEGSITAPDEADTYDVFCIIHPSITGTLTVEG